VPARAPALAEIARGEGGNPFILYLLSPHVIASDFCEAIPEFSVEIASSAQNASSQ